MFELKCDNYELLKECDRCVNISIYKNDWQVARDRQCLHNITFTTIKYLFLVYI